MGTMCSSGKGPIVIYIGDRVGKKVYRANNFEDFARIRFIKPRKFEIGQLGNSMIYDDKTNQATLIRRSVFESDINAQNE